VRARAEFVAVVVVAADISEFRKGRAKAAVPWDLFIASLLFLSLSLSSARFCTLSNFGFVRFFPTASPVLGGQFRVFNELSHSLYGSETHKKTTRCETTTTTTEHDVANPTETTTGVVVFFSVFFFSLRRHRRVDHPSARVRMHSKVSQRETSSSSSFEEQSRRGFVERGNGGGKVILERGRRMRVCDSVVVDGPERVEDDFVRERFVQSRVRFRRARVLLLFFFFGEEGKERDVLRRQNEQRFSESGV